MRSSVNFPLVVSEEDSGLVMFNLPRSTGTWKTTHLTPYNLPEAETAPLVTKMNL